MTVYPLPDSIPTVRVTGEYRGPDGSGLAGTVTFTGPPLLTFAEADLFIAGPVVAKLDDFGRFEVELPATDSPDMSPEDWSYTVRENLTGVSGARTYAMILPAATPGGIVDLADVAPSDPLTPNYVPVVGPTGPQGIQGLQGIQGVQGIDGSYWYVSSVAHPDLGDVTGQRVKDMFFYPQSGDVFQWDGDSWEYRGNIRGPQGNPGAGNVDTVNGIFGPNVVLTAEDVNALDVDGGTVWGTLSVGTSNLVSTTKISTNGALGFENSGTPAPDVDGTILYANSGVLHIVEGSGHEFPLVESVPLDSKGAANGVATLNASSKIPDAQFSDWQTFTLNWTANGGTAPALGNSVVTAEYRRLGKTVEFNVKIVFGTTAVYSTGGWRFNAPLPVAVDTSCTFQAVKTSVQTFRGGFAYLSSSVAQSAAMTALFFDNVDVLRSTVPFTWAATDVLVISGSYKTT